MFGPSGFFTPGGVDDFVSSQEMELFHSSRDGFNDLYRASRNGRLFVYKALKPEYVGNMMYEDLLRKDFNIGFSLQHGHICQYYAYSYIPEIGNVIVMEWVDGVTLEQMLPQLRRDKKLAMKVVRELCDALDYMAQKQVYHRDLKPENIIVTHNGNNVKIIDFGLSDSDSYASFKAPAGTRMYASPELLAGEQIDGRSDLWSLGVILGEMGFKGKAVKKCLKRDRDERYSTAAELYADLSKSLLSKALYIVAAICLVVLIILFHNYLLKNSVYSQPVKPEAVEVAIPASPVSDDVETAEDGNTLEDAAETVFVNEVPAPAEEKKNPEEYIDNASLDALLNAASGEIK
jgi:serine/threonine protein kinase